MHIRDVIAATSGRLIRGDESTIISSIAFNSRDVTSGSLFVALRGGYTDGHRFLEDARRAGAVAALVERGVPAASFDEYESVIEVADTRAALAPASARFYDHPSTEMTVVGVTGTDGKTTTSYFIDAICRSATRRPGLIGTIEVRVGDEVDRHSSRQTTPESLQIQGLLRRMRDTGVDTAIVEATSHGLAMHRLDCCEFDVGVVTNITHEHLDFHGSVERYRAAKGRLLEFVDVSRQRGKLGIGVINIDDERARSIQRYGKDCTFVMCSPAGSPTAYVRALERDLTPEGSMFELQVGEERQSVSIHLPGAYNVANAVLAAGAAHALGIDCSTIGRGLSSLRSVPGRMERIDEGQPFAVLVDYAHSPEAIRGVLGEARRLAQGKVLVLFGSAGERDIEKRRIQGAIAAELSDYAVFTSEDPRYEDPDAIIAQIASGAIEAGRARGVDFECIEDRRQAIAHVLAQAREGDVVVLAGKGHERSMIYEHEFRPWDEAEVCRTVLRSMNPARGPGWRSSDS